MTIIDLDSKKSDRNSHCPLGSVTSFSDLFSALDANAADEDSGLKDISCSMSILRDAGFLKAALPVDAGGNGLGMGGAYGAASVRVFIELGEANLSVARLFEGHVNALQLLILHGHDTLRRKAFEHVRRGAVLGVWGADGDAPVRLSADGDELTGSKRFASGLGVVSYAVVTVNAGRQVRLCLVPVDEAARQHKESWAMAGMKATASGDYDVHGISERFFDLFGEPGCYLKEPWFVGGVWRIAAIQLGGTFGLLDAARSRLAQLGRLNAEAQVARLAIVLKRALGAVGLVERAARYAGSAPSIDNPERAVARSILVRLLTEEVGQAAIGAVERSIGLQHFQDGSATGRIARDLSVYMRQATGDAFLQRAGVEMLAAEGRLSELAYE